MRKILDFIPDIFDIQYNPRLQGEAYWYTLRFSEGITYGWMIRIGQFKVFWEYLKK